MQYFSLEMYLRERLEGIIVFDFVLRLTCVIQAKGLLTLAARRRLRPARALRRCVRWEAECKISKACLWLAPLLGHYLSSSIIRWLTSRSSTSHCQVHNGGSAGGFRVPWWSQTIRARLLRGATEWPSQQSDKIRVSAQCDSLLLRFADAICLCYCHRYAWSLIRSKYRADVKRGIILLEDLCSSGDEDGKVTDMLKSYRQFLLMDISLAARRDYLFYLSIANTKLGEYDRAHECVKKFLTVEPENRQAQELEKIIKDRMTKEGLKGEHWLHN